MAISRFIIQQWPHLNWFPWWFAGEPFENSYTPMLHLIDAAAAWMTGVSTPRAFNFMTGLFYAAGPVFLFLFAWKVSRFLETSLFAALIYSLFSPAALFQVFRSDVGALWNPWRLRVLVYYGEGPHTAILSALPLALLLMYLAITKRTYLWCALAIFMMAFVTLINAFGAIDLAVGAACLILALRGRDVGKSVLLIAGLAFLAYCWSSPLLPPSVLGTISRNSQFVGGDFSFRKLLATQGLMLPGFVLLWLVTRRIGDYFTRFSLLFAYVFYEIVALYAIADVAALPQPHRYSLEMELALALAGTFLLRPAITRFGPRVRGVLLCIFLLFLSRQALHYERYAKLVIQPIDITQTIEYRTAKWFDQHLGGLRAFVTAQAGTWLNVFSDTPQMHSGHDPFNPNLVEEAATYAIFSGQNAGTRDAEISILWLKAFGCHAIYVPGPHSRVDGKPFNHPEKFQGRLAVLWHEEDDTIYAVPQRTKSLAHVVPLDAVVKRVPIHGLDVDEVDRYVAALDDPSFPADAMTWVSPTEGHLITTMSSHQVVSVQSTYDKGWRATANGHPVEVTPDGIGLTVIHSNCSGSCDVRLIFDGGLERRVCRGLSWSITVGLLGGAWIAFRRRLLY